MTEFYLGVDDGVTTALEVGTSVATTSVACYVTGTRISNAWATRRAVALRAVRVRQPGRFLLVGLDELSECCRAARSIVDA